MIKFDVIEVVPYVAEIPVAVNLTHGEAVIFLESQPLQTVASSRESKPHLIIRESSND